MKFFGVPQKIALQKQKKAIKKLKEYCDESGNVIKKCKNLEAFSLILSESKLPIYEARYIYHQMLKKVNDFDDQKESELDPFQYIDSCLQENRRIFNLYVKEENKEERQKLLALYLDTLLSIQDLSHSKNKQNPIYQKKKES